MPKLKPFRFEENQRMARSVVSKYMDLTNTDEEKAAVVIRVTKRCFQDKRKRPETFSLNELWAFAESVNMTGADRAILMGAKDIKQVFVEDN